MVRGLVNRIGEALHAPAYTICAPVISGVGVGAVGVGANDIALREHSSITTVRGFMRRSRIIRSLYR
jgi:hypothetical protein